MREGEGKVFRSGMAMTMFVSIPARVVLDAAFPFSDGEHVQVKIAGDGKSLEVVKQ